jgi:hypothetical protein
LTESFASNDTSLEHKRPPTLTVQPIPNPGCMLVTRPAAYIPNDVETAPMQLRPPPITKKWRLQPDLPEVIKPDLYMGYYDLKIHVQASSTPWLELMDATKDVMNESWNGTQQSQFLCMKRKSGLVMVLTSPLRPILRKFTIKIIKNIFFVEPLCQRKDSGW